MHHEVLLYLPLRHGGSKRIAESDSQTLSQDLGARLITHPPEQGFENVAIVASRRGLARKNARTAAAQEEEHFGA